MQNIFNFSIQELQESTYKDATLCDPSFYKLHQLLKKYLFKASGKLGNKEDSKAAVAGEEMSPFISCSPFFTLSHYQHQAAWLLRAVTCIDLTTLAGDDTETNVSRLCLKAARPVRKDLLEAMDMAEAGLTTGAVCVYPNRVKECVQLLKK